MNTEYEVRVLEINKEELEQKLEKFGATKLGEYLQKRKVYDLNPAVKGKWIRLRSNGKKTTLAYKDIVSDNIDGTKEIEFEVPDFEQANLFLEKIGFQSRNYQENKRVQYLWGEVEIDIDTWPLIPTYVEIEGKEEESVIKAISLLQLDSSKVTSKNVEEVYRHYNIELNEIKELRF